MPEPIQFVPLLKTFNSGDIAFIKSILDAHDIVYHIEGENFMQIRPLVAPARIMIAKNQLEETRELLKDFKSGIFGFGIE
ncbi:MAG: DUF2007 domain-containing protein [Candidatus Omnitrophica bacterium]|nr:DUF2007 domain-containing protein [Candidatus Omnitrophota bacterium]